MDVAANDIATHPQTTDRQVLECGKQWPEKKIRKIPFGSLGVKYGAGSPEGAARTICPPNRQLLTR